MKTGQRSLNLLFWLAGGALILFVVLPLGSTLLASTPQAIAETLVDPEVIASTVLTFGAGAIATVIAMLTGVPLAYLLARRHFRGRRVVESLMDLPIVIPHTAAGIALLMVFGSRGVLGRFLAPLGIYFTENLAGIVIAMLFVSLPFLVTTSRQAFALVESELEQAALVDGASAWQAIWHVTLPIVKRSVAAGALMMWARGISEFGAVVILAYHPKILPVLVYERFAGFGLSAAQPVAVVMILVAILVFGLLRFWVAPEKE